MEGTGGLSWEGKEGASSHTGFWVIEDRSIKYTYSNCLSVTQL